MAINAVILSGRLTANPELRTTSTGISVTRFSIAVDRISKNGEEKKADFINIVAWRGTAEFIEKYYHKGDSIAVEGKIQTNKYTDSSGQNRMSFEVLADKVHFMGSKKEATQFPQTQSTPADDFEEISDSEPLF